jgi:general secretion pathway protein I
MRMLKHTLRPRTTRRGFSLLEVLVAITILGLGLTAILSSQAGLFASVQTTEKLSLAVPLVRCRMNEIEIELLRNGYPIIDQADEGDCCQDIDDTGFLCKWRIETVELPDPSPAGDGDGDGDGGLDDPLAEGMDAFTDLKAGGPDALADGGGMGAVAGMLGGGGGLLGMVMGFIYPTLKGMLESSIRKVVVTIEWQEGNRERSFDVVQIVTNPMLPNPELQSEDEFDEDGAPSVGSPGPSSPIPFGGLSPGTLRQ